MPNDPMHNRRKDDTREVVPVLVSEDPEHGVRVSQPMISRIHKPGVIFGLVMTGMLAMLSMTILVVYLAPSVDRLTERTETAADEREDLVETIAGLQRELDTILEEQREERLVDDCLTLFRSDIEFAKGVAQVTLGDNLASAILTPGTADDLLLAQEVFDTNQVLRDALAELEAYLLIDPPPGVCPHPKADL